jgi:hypothetical protein
VLHDAGYTWNEANALAQQWPSLRNERKIIILLRGSVRLATRRGDSSKPEA